MQIMRTAASRRVQEAGRFSFSPDIFVGSSRRRKIGSKLVAETRGWKDLNLSDPLVEDACCTFFAFPCDRRGENLQRRFSPAERLNCPKVSLSPFLFWPIVTNKNGGPDLRTARVITSATSRSYSLSSSPSVRETRPLVDARTRLVVNRDVRAFRADAAAVYRSSKGIGEKGSRVVRSYNPSVSAATQYYAVTTLTVMASPITARFCRARAKWRPLRRATKVESEADFKSDLDRSARNDFPSIKAHVRQTARESVRGPR